MYFHKKGIPNIPVIESTLTAKEFKVLFPNGEVEAIVLVDFDSALMEDYCLLDCLNSQIEDNFGQDLLDINYEYIGTHKNAECDLFLMVKVTAIAADSD